MVDIKKLGESIVEVVKTFVTQQIGVLSKRVDMLVERLDELPMPKDGQDGKNGIDGKSIDAAEVEALVLRAIEALPPPKDGISVTLGDVAPLIADQVKAAVAEIPAPQNGKDADPEAIAELVRTEVAKIPLPIDGKSVTVDEVAPLIEAEVSKAVAAIPAPKDGKDAEPIDKAGVIQEILAALPAPKDGQSVTIDDVAPLIEQQVKAAVEALPKPADGKDAEPLDHGAVVKDVLAAIRVPEDGKSLAPADVEPMLAEMLAKAIEALPKPKDGEGVPVDQVQKMIDEAVSKAMEAVQMPKDGEHGRDALDIEILPAINESRRYARGTYASHNGGVWVARRSTEGMDGWECIIDGVAEIEVSFIGRSGFVSVQKSSGTPDLHPFTLPAMLYRGVFREGDDYEQGDTVTWGGSLWFCNERTKDKPADGSKAWQLAAKRGRDGKDGRDGIDMTKAVKL